MILYRISIRMTNFTKLCWTYFFLLVFNFLYFVFITSIMHQLWNSDLLPFKSPNFIVFFWLTKLKEMNDYVIYVKGYIYTDLIDCMCLYIT